MIGGIFEVRKIPEALFTTGKVTITLEFSHLLFQKIDSHELISLQQFVYGYFGITSSSELPNTSDGITPWLLPSRLAQK